MEYSKEYYKGIISDLEEAEKNLLAMWPVFTIGTDQYAHKALSEVRKALFAIRTMAKYAKTFTTLLEPEEEE